MAVIHVLDKHTAGLIAAGEVVERPASVVKELTENAIDAGASHITVAIQDGGIACIEIRDDGCGIEPDDMHNAFIPHATSKIATGEDLEHICTLGFRGEALASVAGVARVTLTSRTAQNEYAFCYRIEGGEELSLEEAARPQGTTVEVRDLFYNTPARMKFLKKDASEAGYVQEVLTHLALSHPEISFQFIKNDKEAFFTPGDGRLASAAAALFPRDYVSGLVTVSYRENGMEVSGLVTPPRAARASRGMQNFYVNRRFVKCKTMMAAAENAFRGLLMGGRFPGCILFLTLPAELVDVNVHPAKTEVRFSRENDIFGVVYKAVRSAVMTPAGMEKRLELKDDSASFGVQIAYAKEMPPTALPKEPAETEGVDATKTLSGAGTSVKLEISAAEERPPAWTASTLYPPREEEATAELNDIARSGSDYLADDKLLTGFPLNRRVSLDISPEPLSRPPEAVRDEKAVPAEVTVTEVTAPSLDRAQKAPSLEAEPAALQETAGPQQEVFAGYGREELKLVGEVFKTYIIAQRGEQLCFIDKHAAHERLIYESLSRNYGEVAGQLLLMPVSVSLTPTEKAAVLEQQDYLAGIGLDVDDFGGNTVAVRSVPADIEADDIEDMVLDIASKLAAGQNSPLSEKTSWVLHSVSCRAAMKAGDTSHSAELVKLATDILDGSVPPFCPHGRPVVLKITQKELEKQFGRLG